MNAKNYTDVLIGGKIYTLGGLEEEGYLRQVAAYLNDKLQQMESAEGYRRMPEDYQQLMLNLNLADDYFKEREHSSVLALQKERLEREVYQLKSELVNMKMKESGGKDGADGKRI